MHMNAILSSQTFVSWIEIFLNSNMRSATYVKKFITPPQPLLPSLQYGTPAHMPILSCKFAFSITLPTLSPKYNYWIERAFPSASLPFLRVAITCKEITTSPRHSYAASMEPADTNAIIFSRNTPSLM